MTNWGYLAELGPHLGAVLPEASGESPEVGDDTSRDENISSQVVVCVLQVICCLGPPGQIRFQSLESYSNHIKLTRMTLHGITFVRREHNLFDGGNQMYFRAFLTWSSLHRDPRWVSQPSPASWHTDPLGSPAEPSPLFYPQRFSWGQPNGPRPPSAGLSSRPAGPWWRTATPPPLPGWLSLEPQPKFTENDWGVDANIHNHVFVIRTYLRKRSVQIQKHCTFTTLSYTSIACIHLHNPSAAEEAFATLAGSKPDWTMYSLRICCITGPCDEEISRVGQNRTQEYNYNYIDYRSYLTGV